MKTFLFAILILALPMLVGMVQSPVLKIGSQVHFICPNTHADRIAKVVCINRNGTLDLLVYKGEQTYSVEEVQSSDDKTPGTYYLVK